MSLNTTNQDTIMHLPMDCIRKYANFETIVLHMASHEYEFLLHQNISNLSNPTQPYTNLDFAEPKHYKKIFLLYFSPEQRVTNFTFESNRSHQESLCSFL